MAESPNLAERIAGDAWPAAKERPFETAQGKKFHETAQNSPNRPNKAQNGPVRELNFPFLTV